MRALAQREAGGEQEARAVEHRNGLGCPDGRRGEDVARRHLEQHQRDERAEAECGERARPARERIRRSRERIRRALDQSR
jgi:hypothetical protein